MRNNSKGLLGILCLATGGAVILSMILPNWIWTVLTALVLIGCGVLFFLYWVGVNSSESLIKILISEDNFFSYKKIYCIIRIKNKIIGGIDYEDDNNKTTKVDF